MTDLWIQPTGAALAADVHGIDLSKPISDTVFARIAQAWGEHLVLRFSGQKLDDRMLMQFSARFGELDRVPISAAGLDRADSDVIDEAREWVAVIASVKKDGKAVGIGHASGHRLRIGDHQIVVYRSLLRNDELRTVLGYHTAHETMIGLFDKDGDIHPLVLVE